MAARCAITVWTADGILGMDAILTPAFPTARIAAASSGRTSCFTKNRLTRRWVSHALDAIRAADTMLVIGTSLVVYPAAMYVRYFRGRHLILINKAETPYDKLAELAFHEDIIDVVAALNPR